MPKKQLGIVRIGDEERLRIANFLDEMAILGFLNQQEVQGRGVVVRESRTRADLFKAVEDLPGHPYRTEKAKSRDQLSRDLYKSYSDTHHFIEGDQWVGSVLACGATLGLGIAACLVHFLWLRFLLLGGALLAPLAMIVFLTCKVEYLLDEPRRLASKVQRYLEADEGELIILDEKENS